MSGAGEERTREEGAEPAGFGEGPDPVRCSDEEGRRFRSGVFRRVDPASLSEAPEGEG